MIWLRSKLPWGRLRLIGAFALCLGAAASFNLWWPALSNWVDAAIAAGRGHASSNQQTDSDSGPGHGPAHAHAGHAHAGHTHAGHDHAGHDHAGHDHPHDDATSLELSSQARLNLGLTDGKIQPVRLENYRRTISVPAVVVKRPGRTELQVSTPMTGVVTEIHAVPGEAVEPGALLFAIRLTHEDLVQAQTEFLKTLGELDVEEREIARLQEVASSGAIAGKTLLERHYARDKLKAVLTAQRESLRLHGLSEQQIEGIAQGRRLLRELQVYAPVPGQMDRRGQLQLTSGQLRHIGYSVPRGKAGETAPLVLEQLDVHQGQSVSAGERLCVLADYQKLYIEGRAFDQDGGAVTEALQRQWPVQAIFENRNSREGVLEGLKLAFVSNNVDPASRTLSFFVELPNEIVRDDTNSEGQRYVAWRYRPGQRLQLRVPVEEWENQIVLPVEAVVKEGAEFFVFQENGTHFDRVPVHVKYRDQNYAVIHSDGLLTSGDRVAMCGAHQMQMALKNKVGGGVDPHAGHHH